VKRWAVIALVVFIWLPLVVVLTLVLARSVAAVDVTTCGQSVGDAATGVLQVDLDCTGAVGVCLQPGANDQDVSCTSDAVCNVVRDPCANAAVLLGAGAVLQLNGHTITGAGIVCSAAGTCTVVGPGSIVSAPVGILARKKVVASGLTIDGGVIGIVSRRGGAILTNLSLTDNSEDGMWSWKGTIRATGVTATGNVVVMMAWTFGRGTRAGLSAFECALGALGPAQRKLHCAFDFVVRRRQADAFVKLHYDVRIEQILDFDRAFRGQFEFRAVEVRAERHALLVDLPQL